MIDKTKITKEMLEKAAQCNTAEELIALAKKEGFEVTKAEAEAYLAELENCELDAADLDKVAGGTGNDDGCWTRNID
ncbi:MAG: Nif11-like leader peptide family RiPP precursor [Spirochaetia bacterium]|nr:Nif11-like leader peptide family RiPP precursor [Spirochaetia bacterium]